MMDVCYSCLSNSGERRISPGQTLLEGQYWYVEHAYPCGLLGWVVIVLKRHAIALHELSSEELAELGVLQAAVIKAQHDYFNCAKEYIMALAEAEHFEHVHVHIVPRAADLPAELKGSKIFAYLKVSPEKAIPPEDIQRFCVEFSGMLHTLLG